MSCNVSRLLWYDKNSDNNNSSSNNNNNSNDNNGVFHVKSVTLNPWQCGQGQAFNMVTIWQVPMCPCDSTWTVDCCRHLVNNSLDPPIAVSDSRTYDRIG
ncbi:unnamed protein product [Polarella glacialis]|uniref:Uncharacterized protein n=1 Tax=Polarella glacialis TaxID=89957 RepID=A0A813HBV4_POLGL|nr:unnamed protein product [Polarella glacialis]